MTPNKPDISQAPTKSSSLSTMFHMHASRPGPVLSNEIMLSIKEHERNPHLKKIIGVNHPGGIVAKYLSYWTGGLPAHITKQICDNVEKRFSVSHGQFAVVVSLQADILEYSADRFVDDCLLPIYLQYKNEFNEHGIYDSEIRMIAGEDNAQNFASVLINCSTALINMILDNHSLPTLQIVHVPEEMAKKYGGVRHVDDFMMKRHMEDSANRRKKQLRHVHDFLRKDLKVYKNIPNDSQLAKLHRRFKANLAHHNVQLDQADIASFYESGAQLTISSADYISIANHAYQKAIVNGPGDISYLNGEEMVRVMFDLAASRTDVYMGKQEFMRDFDYGIYELLSNEFPHLDTQFAAFKTWDTTVFPEFDTNLVCGLKYLKD